MPDKKTHEILVIDARRCTGCEVCESVCSMVHDEEFNPLNSRINRVRIEPIINTSLNCLSCYDPECIKACQINALTKDPATGIIHVDDACDGCAACVRACPFGVITVHTKNSKAIMCDMCESVEGVEGPQCVEYCPKSAIIVEKIDPSIDEDREITVSRILDRGFPGEGMLN